LSGDPAPANALIKKDNPEMTDAIIANAIAQMRDRGMVQGGDAATLGVGAMTDERWKTFFDMMKEAKVYDDKVDVAKAYTLAFVNNGRGVTRPPTKEQK
jgi:NitT/TauT family transport system substrate-binding protein